MHQAMTDSLIDQRQRAPEGQDDRSPARRAWARRAVPQRQRGWRTQARVSTWLKPWAEPYSHLRSINHPSAPLQMSKLHWQEVPGKRPSKEPFRRVRYDRALRCRLA
jgi:hypothetical protein